MALEAGARLGPYEIQSLLGAGGMGEVYRARDTRLDRVVAIKVLAPALAADPQFRDRFDREARAISSLSHPHICPLFDVGHQDPSTGSGQAVDYLVMEYLEGESLAARLAGGALPLDRALTYAIEIAGALDAAHRQGIVHRDLKPGNVMVTKSGTKLLDFGLAKTGSGRSGGSGASAGPGGPDASAAGPGFSPANLTAAPTMTTPPSLTQHGTMLGTIQYMSPEQIHGVDADARSDVFAFGALVYEMVSGKKAFAGKSQFSVMGAILDHDPSPLSALQPAAPAALDRLVKKCLAKDPDARWQTARDLASELEWIAESASDPVAEVTTAATTIAPQPAKVTRARLLSIGGAGLAAGIVLMGIAAWTAMRLSPQRAAQTARFAIVPPPSLPLQINGSDRDIAISQDGSHIVYRAGTGQFQLMVRALDQLDARPLVGIAPARVPFVSPDGHWVGYFTAGGGELKKVSITGGPPITLSNHRQPTRRELGAGRHHHFRHGRPRHRVAERPGRRRRTESLDEGRHGTWRVGSFFPVSVARRSRRAVYDRGARSAG